MIHCYRRDKDPFYMKKYQNPTAKPCKKMHPEEKYFAVVSAIPVETHHFGCQK